MTSCVRDQDAAVAPARRVLETGSLVFESSNQAQFMFQ